MGADPLYIGNYRKQRMMSSNVIDQFNQKLPFRNVRHFIEYNEKNESALRYFLKGLVTDESGVQHRIGDNPAFLEEIPTWYSYWFKKGDHDLIDEGQLLIGHVSMNANFEKYDLPGNLNITFRDSYFMISGLAPRYWHEDEKAFAFCMAKMIATTFGGNLCFFAYDSAGGPPGECIFVDEPEGYLPGMTLEDILALSINKYIQPIRF